MRSLVFAVLILLLGSPALHSQAPAAAGSEERSGRDVMQHWVGDWTGGVAGAADTKVPHFAHTPDHANAVWTLDEHFVQGTNFNKDGQAVGVWLMRHDPASQKFQVWFFDAQGGVSAWNGTWDRSKQTMTWETRDAESQTTGSGETRFVDGRQEWTMTVRKDGTSEESSGSLTRKSSGG